MAEFLSSQFGALRYEAAQVIHFPAGLPAFEEEREFLPVEEAANAPLIFLQSLRDPDLTFITLPVNVVAPDYELELAEEDLAALGWNVSAQPGIPGETLCLAIVTAGAGVPATVNLMAPLVINRATGIAAQVIQTSGAYSHQHPLGEPKGDPEC